MSALQIDAREVLDLTMAGLRIPSPAGGEKGFAFLLGDWLRARGFAVNLIDVLPDRPNLVAVAPGNPACKSFLLTGHLDAPSPFGTWRHDPFDPWIEDGWLYGCGVADMKGGMTATAVSAAALARIPPDRRGDVIYVGVIHHDTHGLGNKFFLSTNDLKIDAALSAVPSNMKVQLKVSGACIWEVATAGDIRHISRQEECVNAIDPLLAILQRFQPGALTYEPQPDTPYLPRVMIAQIDGNSRRGESCTAESARARGDVRFMPGMTPSSIMQDLQRQVDDVLKQHPDWQAALRLIRYQMPYEMQADHPLVRMVVQYHTEVAGTAPELTCGLPTGGYITDMADMHRFGIPAVLYGPGDWNTTPNEGLPVADLVTTAQVSARVGAEVLGSRRG